MFNYDETISKLVQKIKSYSMNDALDEFKKHKEKIPKSVLRPSTSYRHLNRTIAILKFTYNLKRQTLMEELQTGVTAVPHDWGVFIFSITPEEKRNIESLFLPNGIRILETSPNTSILFDTRKLI